MDYTPAPTMLLDHDVSMEVFLVTYSYGELCFCVCEDNSVKEHEQSEDAQYNMLPHFSNVLSSSHKIYIFGFRAPHFTHGMDVNGSVFVIYA